MSDTLENLGRKISGAGDLKSVVRTMKVLAASNIVQYEKAVVSLSDFYRTVEMGLMVCFQKAGKAIVTEKEWIKEGENCFIVAFGSDQGLVGQFNETISDFICKIIANLKGKKIIWPVGERIEARLLDNGLEVRKLFEVPNSVSTITLLIGQILLEFESQPEDINSCQLFLFYNRPKHGAIYEPVVQRLLPLDEKWRNNLKTLKWPTKYLPEAINGVESSLHGLIRNYLFVSLFRACAESLASENASRLAAMQRAEKNIDELLEELTRGYHRLRQSSIDEELFDVISGSEAISKEK